MLQQTTCRCLTRVVDRCGGRTALPMPCTCLPGTTYAWVVRIGWQQLMDVYNGNRWNEPDLHVQTGFYCPPQSADTHGIKCPQGSVCLGGSNGLNPCPAEPGTTNYTLNHVHSCPRLDSLLVLPCVQVYTRTRGRCRMDFSWIEVRSRISCTNRVVVPRGQLRPRNLPGRNVLYRTSGASATMCGEPRQLLPGGHRPHGW